MAEGSITIDVLANTDKFDKQIASLEDKMKKEEDKKINIDTQINNLQGQSKELEKLKREAEEARWQVEKLQNMPNKAKELGLQLRPSDYLNRLNEARINYDVINQQISQQSAKMSEVNAKMAKLKSEQDAVNASISQYKQQIEQVKLQQQVAQADELKKRYQEIGNSVKGGFVGVGKSIQDSINKVARLALGIFGLRSAYMAVRRASSELATYDKQYAANIEYIRFALTQMIAPVLRYIVSLVATILGYINAILSAWFGINLFGKASAKDFQKMKAGAGGTAKAVKEIKKQLAGFDEINMLSDQSDSGGGGGGGAGGAMPDFDLSALNGNIPEWLQWIIDNKDLILAVMAGIASALLAWKLGLDAIKALGIGVLVAGIVFTIQALLAYLKDPSWKNFGKIIQGIGVAIAGLGILIGSVPAIVIGAIVLIVGTIIKYWDEIQAFLQKGINWLKDRAEWVRTNLGDIIGNIYDLFVKNLQLILNWFDNTFRNIKAILDGIIQFVKGVFTGNWRMALDGLKNIGKALLDWFINTIKSVFQLAINIIDQALNTIKGFFKLVWTGIIAGISALWGEIKANFGGIVSWIGGIISAVIGKFRDFGIKAGEVIGGAFRGAVNGVLRAIENILNSPIRAINSLISTINAVPGINLSHLRTFSLPRLASGGIVNMPNRRNNARRCDCRREW